MPIAEVTAAENYKLRLIMADGRSGEFDVTPYLKYEAFQPLLNAEAFARVSSGGYFIEWECGADLSADTIEAGWKISGEVPSRTPG